MTDIARRHYRYRTLTGITFGVRGAPIYARIYDKTRQAAPDAVIRQVWRRALNRQLDDGDVVWRVEFELRPEFLNSLAENDEHVSSEPAAVLDAQLDAIWRYLTARWLVLFLPESATRPSRCATEPWWDALSAVEGLSGRDGIRNLERKRRRSRDPAPLLRQLAGVLVAYGARAGQVGRSGVAR